MNRETLCALALLALAASAHAADLKTCPPQLAADAPVVPRSLEQAEIDGGGLRFEEIVAHGRRLFTAKFNVCDGAGRPETTGAGEKRAVPVFSEEGDTLSAGQVAKLRIPAPDSDSCAGCHSDPEPGGSGDFVANVFVLAQALDPVTLSASAARSNSRNTLGMHGAGPIEMLAREMSAELQRQALSLPDGDHTLTAKGVGFDVIIERGTVIAAEGIDTDLVVKPFHQAGKVVSLREFSANAMNHHHGMQAEERFDRNPAKGFDPDFDGDGVYRELTLGDLTAISLWQAQLATPAQVMPGGRHARERVRRGEKVFADIGCADCHVPAMALDSRYFVEPNPFNPPGTCAGPADGCGVVGFDMTRQGDGPRLERASGGRAIVRADTDLKRHNLCDEPGPGAIRYYCNERLDQGRAGHAGRPGAEYFLTRKLWDVGSSAPYGHRGDISTITEAILLHGGEARTSRDAFADSAPGEQQALVEFLKTLQVVRRSHRG